MGHRLFMLSRMGKNPYASRVDDSWFADCNPVMWVGGMSLQVMSVIPLDNVDENGQRHPLFHGGRAEPGCDGELFKWRLEKHPGAEGSDYGVSPSQLLTLAALYDLVSINYQLDMIERGTLTPVPLVLSGNLDASSMSASNVRETNKNYACSITCPLINISSFFLLTSLSTCMTDLY